LKKRITVTRDPAGGVTLKTTAPFPKMAISVVLSNAESQFIAQELTGDLSQVSVTALTDTEPIRLTCGRCGAKSMWFTGRDDTDLATLNAWAQNHLHPENEE
jgi:hypothetical protein